MDRSRAGSVESIDRSSGVAIGVGWIAMVACMATHPTATSHEFIAEVQREALATRIVHGAAIASLWLAGLGLLRLAERLGTRSIRVRGAIVAYAVGAVFLSAAATVNGFVVPGLALSFDEAQIETFRPLLQLCREANRACDYAGIVALCASLALWSLALVGRPGAASRTLGVLGLVLGVLPLVALAAGHLPMTVHGMGAFVLGQAVWYVVIAVRMVRGSA
jgi:hypothetical protein